MLLPLNNFKGKYSNGSYPVLTNERLDCKTKNVVYLITCRICAAQYVGETVREFGVRMREHWDKIRKGDKSQIVYSHFQSDERHKNCRIEDMLRFQIIEKVKTEDITNQDDGLIRKRRLEREMFWIAKLRTAYPLGLNDRLQALGIAGNATDSTFKDFNFYRVCNILDRKKKKNRGRRLRKKKAKVDESQFELFRRELIDAVNTNVEQIIARRTRAFLEKFTDSRPFKELRKEIRCLIENKVAYARKIRPEKKKIDKITWKVDFSHKILGEVNIQSLYGLREMRELLPTQLRNSVPFRKVFIFGKTLGSRVLNYNKCLKEAGEMTYDEMMNMECDCQTSEFVNSHHGHIMTGNLDIIRDDRLKEVCSYGTKFREVPRLNLALVKDKFKSNVDNLITSFVRKYKIPKIRFKEWQIRFVDIVNNRLDYLARTRRWDAPVLSNRSSKIELDRLQKNYVITVVDKAAGNFAFTCKKFYFLRLAKELGLDNQQPGNETYLYVDRTEQEICQDIVGKLEPFGALPKDDEKRVAMLYHNPKFHKNPVKFRFIAGNVKVVTSRLDEIVAKVLKMCKGHFENLCEKYRGFSGIRYSFDIEKSADLKLSLDSYNGDARSISINDFSTLYTLFEHDHLVRNMTWLLDRLSKNSGCQYVRVTHERAYWSRDGNAEGSFSITEILEMVSLLIGESYVKAFGKVFRQTKGIIMGGKSSGWLSDCSLMVDEFKYIDSIVKSGNLDLARQFSGLNRYRDDCTALNLDNFRDLARDIYPPSLELSQENDDLRHATVLDMQVEVVDGRFRTKVYNKTDSFPFEVVSMPFIESNIDSKICYKVFYSQILRYQRLCTLLVDFTDRVRILGNILLKRNYSKVKLAREFRLVIGNYRAEFERWSIPIDIQSWFNDIFNNPQDNLSPDSALPNSMIPSFSQPIPENNTHRFTTLSQ